MEEHESMGNKVSTCIYVDRGVLETARNVGFNISKVSENALIEAVGKLNGAKPEIGSNSRVSSVAEGRGRDSDPGARLHRPIGHQATHSRPRYHCIQHNLQW